MKNIAIRKCSKCEGKGTVFNKLSLMLTVAWPIAWLVDEGDGSGLIRKLCSYCNGKGYFKI